MKNIISFIFRGFKFRTKVDPNEIKYLISNLKKGDIAVDIGANKGGYLYWMKKKVGRSGKVYAFEPQKILFTYLKDTLIAMNTKNVIVENFGISDEEREVSFFVPKKKSGVSQGARIDFLDDGKIYVESKINTVTLDQYFYDKNIFPHLIKIDVEGHEKQVINGALELLKAARPKLILEAENRHLSGGEISEIFDIICNLGYAGYFYDKNKLKVLIEFDAKVHQRITEGKFWEAPDYINNFIFEPI